MDLHQEILNYNIGKQIGKGTFGTVNICFDNKKGERRVIKRIKDKTQYLKFAKKEIKLLKILDENNKDGIEPIIKLYEDFIYNDIQYLVFEYMDINLYKYYFKKEKLPYNEVLYIMYEVAKGLKFIHSLKIIHCDLKPENIMLNLEGSKKVKIIDLGSSNLNEDRKDYFYIQSRYYRAPELVFNIYYNNKIDIWAFGCIFMELLFGTPLIPAKDRNDLVYYFTTLIGIPSTNSRYLTCKLFNIYFTWDKNEQKYVRKHFINKYKQVNLYGLIQLIDSYNFDIGTNKKELHKLLGSIIQYDYNTRIDAEKILESEIFKK
tara:strand:+ start:1042 stop:1995 length:954 start_codon:yes stop_codon:yes gene_type:complete